MISDILILINNNFYTVMRLVFIICIIGIIYSLMIIKKTKAFGIKSILIFIVSGVIIILEIFITLLYHYT